MLAEILGSGVRAKVLSVLLQRPRASLHVRELIRRCDSGNSGMQRAVQQRERAGIVRTRLDDAGRCTITVADELRIEFERATSLSVDLVEEEALTNPYLRDELARTGVVILEAA